MVNNLMTSAVTVHWHGLHQHNNIWMDGVPYVTQCPILPSQYFTYRFIASPSGTHWYHSHLASQRMDGLYGMLIVHKKEPAIPYHLMTVSDWFPWESNLMHISSPFNRHLQGSGELYANHPIRDYSADGVEVSAINYSSALINGRGRFNEQPFPLSRFTVKKDTYYRFRIVNSGVEYAFEISIDNHQLRLAALDGHDIEELSVDSVILYPGERVDFVVFANNMNGSRHWIRAESLRIGKGMSKMPDPYPDGIVYGTKAVLRYEGNNSTLKDPSTKRKTCCSNAPCTVFNCPFLFYPRIRHKECLTIADAKSIKTGSKTIDNKKAKEIFLNSGFNIGSSINGRQFVKPLEPLFLNKSSGVPCHESFYNRTIARLCTHIMSLEYNETYHIILTSYQPHNIYKSHHPIHIHGHGFDVLKIGFSKYNLTTGRIRSVNRDITCHDELCAKARWSSGPPKTVNLKNPPVKDTVVVPFGGYVVIRIKTINPGFWMVHCHSDTHHVEGMALILDGKGFWHLKLREGKF